MRLEEIFKDAFEMILVRRLLDVFLRRFWARKNKWVSIQEIIRLNIMKMKNRSHRYNIDRPRSRQGFVYSKYKKCLSMMMLICAKQHLSNIWSWIHAKVKQHWGWVEKKHCL